MGEELVAATAASRPTHAPAARPAFTRRSAAPIGHLVVRMGGWGRLGITGLGIVGSLAGSAAASAAAVTVKPSAVKPSATCQFAITGMGRVTAVHDGRSFSLDDGREVRLAAIETPLAPAPGDAAGEAGPAAAAKAALEQLVLDQTVELHQRAPTTDRYGRIIAYVTVPAPADPSGTQPSIAQPSVAQPSVAHLLVARGWARVAAGADEPACMAELLSRERVARTQKLGLWGEPDYAIVGAESGTDLLGRQGHFAVVEGKVLSVREVGGTIYMNFGRRWSQALTVTILKRQERTFAAAGLQPDRLLNLKLRVRGFIEERSGPRIEATRPEQIEIAESK
jgi:endonuclease YncB( thermonuclease family)